MPWTVRRHPSGVELGAWFDGEGDADVGAHLAACARCRRRADALGELRTMLRPTPSQPSQPAAPGSTRR